MSEDEAMGRFQGTYFFQPASESSFAYMAPMAPIPIKPIVGWSSLSEMDMAGWLPRACKICTCSYKIRSCAVGNAVTDLVT